MALGRLRALVMDREARCAAVHGVTKSQTRLSNWTELMNFYLSERQKFILSILILVRMSKPVMPKIWVEVKIVQPVSICKHFKCICSLTSQSNSPLCDLRFSVIHGVTKSQTRLSDWTEGTPKIFSRDLLCQMLFIILRYHLPFYTM